MFYLISISGEVRCVKVGMRRYLRKISHNFSPYGGPDSTQFIPDGEEVAPEWYDVKNKHFIPTTLGSFAALQDDKRRGKDRFVPVMIGIGKRQKQVGYTNPT
jgi:hypothetical protein